MIDYSDIIQSYLNNSNTKTFIKYGDESGAFQYSVVVENSGDFWLDSFESEEEARNYILQHSLACTN